MESLSPVIMEVGIVGSWWATKRHIIRVQFVIHFVASHALTITIRQTIRLREGRRALRARLEPSHRRIIVSLEDKKHNFR